MTKNKELETFYQAVYLKGEKKHFTPFLAKGNTSTEAQEVINEIDWDDKTVLDVGCGTGNFANAVAKKGAKHVLGIDFAEEAIRIAKKRYKQKKLDFKIQDVKQLDKKFDVIVSVGTIEHMDNPIMILKKFKKCLNSNGKIIITTPNWTNPRGYILMTLKMLFDSPITLADLHYLTPLNHQEWAQKLEMKLKFRTIEKPWAHGDVLLSDFKRRLPNVLRDSKLPNNQKRINELIKWLEKYVIPLDNSMKHSGAVGLYFYSMKR